MAVPQNKQELLDAIAHSFAKLIKRLETLDEKTLKTLDMEGHAKNTTMNAQQLVSYLIGWNELVLKWLEQDEKGLPTNFPETGFKWNELGRLAQKFYADYATLSWQELLSRLKRAQANLIIAVEKRDNHRLYQTQWYNQWPMGRMIQFNSSSPYDNARKRLMKALKTIQN